MSGDQNPILTLVVGVGYVGRRVLDRLGTRGTIGLSRRADATLLQLEQYDLDAGGPLPIVLPERYRVLYTVAPSAHGPGDERLRNFLDKLQPPPLAFVYISTTGVYGDLGGARVDEGNAMHPTTERAKRRAAAETRLESWCAENGVRLCTLRTPGIYGPDRLGIERIRARAPVINEAEANPGNRIHVDDLASCCIAALDKPEAIGIFNVGDGDHRSSTWFAKEVARQIGLPPPPEVSRSDAKSAFSAERLSFLTESRLIDTRRMQEVLGIEPRYANPEDGIQASLAVD